MSSVRLQILEAMATAWNTDTPTGVPQLVRSPFRQRVVDDDNPVAADLYPLTDEEKSDKGPHASDDTPVSMHELVVALELRAVGADAELPEDIVDPSAVWAARVFNNNTYGGLAQYSRIAGSEYQRTAEGRPAVRLLVGVLVKYITAVNDFEST